MKRLSKSLLALSLCAGLMGVAQAAEATGLESIVDTSTDSHKVVAFLSKKKESHKKEVKKLRSYKKIDVVKTTEKKVQPSAFTLKKGDAELAIGGKAQIQHYFDRNAYLLNSNLPDECEYFKHQIDVNFDASYGQERFGHKAIEAYLDLRHKGTWGKSFSVADRDAGSVDQSSVKVGDAFVGAHSHATGRALPWVSEAWLQVSANAVFSIKSDKIHTLKLGWFPFELGRGISLGKWYGSNREILGLYYYDREDKFAPGINLSGELIKDRLSYDLYYAKFEERNRSLSDTISVIRTHWLDATGIKWRGTGKDDELYAARLKFKALKDSKFGTLELEPYVSYNVASDQWYEIEPDVKTKLGALGLSAEYAKNNFECGAEIATNFGKEDVMAIDRNKVELQKGADGYLQEVYSHVLTIPAVGANFIKAPYIDAAKAQANTTAVLAARQNGAAITAPYYNSGVNAAGNRAFVVGHDAAYADVYNTPLSANRFRPAYTNNFCGWMFVTDAAYKFESKNIKVAATYAYASGDANPHENEVTKNYKGFAGIHEGYYGKRVPSIFLLDQRMLKRPTTLTRNSDELVADMAFTDLHLVGAGATWTPCVCGKSVTLNPNMILFWKACDSRKVILTGVGNAATWEASTTENARKFMGTELNLVAKCELLKDLVAFGNFAAFVPGGYFSDTAGVPLDGDFYKKVGGEAANYDPKNFRIGDSTAYHVNVGFEYKF